MVSVSESPSCIVLRLEESVNNIPSSLKGNPNVVLDGFCNSLELQTFPLNDKPVYFKIYRRRWKVSGDKKHHSNCLPPNAYSMRLSSNENKSENNSAKKIMNLLLPKNLPIKSQKLSNGETILEALSRSRYLLYEYSQNWPETQQERS